MEIPHCSDSPSSPQSSRHTKSWACTQLNGRKCSFAWTIHNFSWSVANTGECLLSPMFPTNDGSENQKWQLMFYPNGDKIENKGYFSLFLKSIACNKSEVQVNFNLSIQNASKNKTWMASNAKSGFISGNAWGFDKFILRSDVVKERRVLLPDDKLTLCCEVNIFAEAIHVSGQQHKIQVPDCNVSANFGKLFESQELSDVILVSADGRELSAHRAILAAQSPVFSQMFKTGMAESISGRVEVTDVEHKVIKDMLRYIYTGNVSDMDKIPQDLLIAADKYALDGLKVMCEYQLFKDLCVSNAVEILILADTHSAEQLKAGVLDFIGSHAIDVMDTNGWRELNKNHPMLISQVLKTLSIQVLPIFGPSLKKQKQ